MKEVASFWYTRKGFKGISPMEILTIKSWLDNGFVFYLYTYNLQDDIFLKLSKMFDKFILKDANEIVDFKLFFTDNKGSGVASFSDYFRYKMIYTTGVAWVDLDMVCLNSFALNDDFIIINEKHKKDNVYGYGITNSMLKFPKESDFGKYLIDESEKIINYYKDRKVIFPWGIIGPSFLSNACNVFEIEDKALNSENTCQIYCEDIYNVCLDSFKINSNAMCLHLYNEMWNKFKMDKYCIYGRQSPYEILKQKYGVYQLLQELNIKTYRNYFYELKIYWIKSKLRYYIRHPRKFFKV